MASFVATDASVAVDIEDQALSAMYRAARRAGRQETGGILVGRYTEFGDRVRVVEATGAPSDSRSFPAAFVRGVVGLTHRLRAAWHRGLYYVGEWHCHPYASPQPSRRDLAQILAFSRDGQYRCPRPVLIIIGGDPQQPAASVHVVLDRGVETMQEGVSLASVTGQPALEHSRGQ
ncbi:MAG: hypothetical protein EPO36_08165 [Chloroflexota bacterium]|nr:MAG: hypothetical protein EPO36_08165 [Chloroflexota bacterium]